MLANITLCKRHKYATKAPPADFLCDADGLRIERILVVKAAAELNVAMCFPGSHFYENREES